MNILDRSHIPRYPIFQDFEYEFLERLAELGYVDLHHRFLPSQPGYTWIGRTGDGYRYDYIFVRSELVPKTLSFEVLSEPRSSGLTDHCGLLASFDLEAPYNPGRGFRVGPQVSFASRLIDGQEALFQ